MVQSSQSQSSSNPEIHVLRQTTETGPNGKLVKCAPYVTLVAPLAEYDLTLESARVLIAQLEAVVNA